MVVILIALSTNDFMAILITTKTFEVIVCGYNSHKNI